MLYATTTVAQRSNNQVKLLHYALDSFQDARVKLRSGQVYSQKMNYNLVTREMIFEQNGKFLAIAHPEEVDTVYFDSRKFVPVGKAFYEYLGGNTVPLFLEHTCTIKEPGAQTGYGTTNSSATTSISTLLNSGGAYELQLPTDFKVIPGHNYYVRKDGQFIKVNNDSQFIKAFPDKKDIIKNWISANHTSFSKSEDLVMLVQQVQ